LGDFVGSYCTSKYFFYFLLSAFNAIGESDRAAALLAEKDFRHAYPQHLLELGKLGLKSRENALLIAREGLKSVRSTFQFVRNGEEMPFEAAIEKFGQLPSKFHTGVVVGSGNAAPPAIEVHTSQK
jgi:hypothetical protein